MDDILRDTNQSKSLSTMLSCGLDRADNYRSWHCAVQLKGLGPRTYLDVLVGPGQCRRCRGLLHGQLTALYWREVSVTDLRQILSNLKQLPTLLGPNLAIFMLMLALSVKPLLLRGRKRRPLQPPQQPPACRRPPGRSRRRRRLQRPPAKPQLLARRSSSRSRRRGLLQLLARVLSLRNRGSSSRTWCRHSQDIRNCSFRLDDVDYCF